MKFAWRPNVSDYASLNSSEIKECLTEEFEDLHKHDMLEQKFEDSWADLATLTIF